MVARTAPRRSWVLALTVVVGLASPGWASPQAVHWTHRSPSMSPSARFGATMTFDAAHGYVLLFGGFSSNGSVLADTWTWKGGNWTERHPATSPPGRKFAFMAFDSTHHEVVLFGGITQSSWIGDTWTWDGTTWTEQQPTSSPPARAGNDSLADDPALGGLLLFGGYDSNQSYNDTWAWNGSNWTQLTPTTSPTSGSPSLTFVPGADKVVLFGLGHETWTFEEATTWIKLSPSVSPPDRSYNAMAGGGKGAVIFGGSGSQVWGDTWSFNGNTWSQLPGAGPSARQYVSMAYDRRHGSMVLFGGYEFSGSYLGDTWTLGP